MVKQSKGRSKHLRKNWQSAYILLVVSEIPDTKVTHLPRIGSDHTPILLDSNPEKTRLQKPFRCLRSWLTHSTLPTVVEASWKLHSENSRKRNFYGLLKLLSSDLAHWNSNTFGNIHKHINSLNNKIDSIHRSGNISKEIEKLKNLKVQNEKRLLSPTF